MDAEEVRVCPRCGAQVFADMNQCFECLCMFDEEEGWGTEEVPLEAYPEQFEDGETEVFAPEGWVLHMSTASVDAVMPVPQTGLMVGRGESCDVVLHAKSVSRKHVHLEPDETGLFVRDLGARNPCMLNGKKVTGEWHMEAGETLAICGTTFVLDRA